MTQRALVNGVIFAAAVASADLVLYQALIVPSLPGWRSVPLAWWALVYAPVVIAILFVGRRTKNFSDLLSSGIAAAVFSTFYAMWAAYAGQPGHLKSLALESPLVFWFVEPVVVFIEFVLLVGVTNYFVMVARGKRRLTSNGADAP